MYVLGKSVALRGLVWIERTWKKKFWILKRTKDRSRDIFKNTTMYGIAPFIRNTENKWKIVHSKFLQPKNRQFSFYLDVKFLSCVLSKSIALRGLERVERVPGRHTLTKKPKNISEDFWNLETDCFVVYQRALLNFTCLSLNAHNVSFLVFFFLVSKKA